MTARLVLLAAALEACFAGESLRVTSGSVEAVLPGRAPWTTVGAPGQDLRWEMRLHDFGAGIPLYAVSIGPFRPGSNGAQVYLSYNWGDTVAKSPVVRCRDRCDDILVRVQREAANRRYVFEVCPTAGGNCEVGTTAIRGFGPASWDGVKLHVRPGVSIAFLRWYSTAVPIGTPILPGGTAGDLGDWEFERSLKDQSGHALDFHPTEGRSLAYTETPSYPPVCSAGADRTYRAGEPARLDGSASYGFDGGRLEHHWRQVAGPTVSWPEGSDAATVSIGALSPGSYTFELTARDSVGRSSVCAVNYGAVVTDDRDVVVTGNAAVETLIGPLIRFGANPWPWFDDRHKAAADVRIAQMDRRYPAYWDVANPGTVTVQPNSNLVTGVGTRFTTTFCGGPEGPHTPKAGGGAAIIVWYPTGNAGETGRLALSVASCEDDTRLTTTHKWPSRSTPAGSGLRYSDAQNREWWNYGEAPANYYDNVAAFYSLYYRSGLTKYRDAARKLADRFWTSPGTDRGAGFVPDPATYNRESLWPARSASLLGLVLRALDGRPDMWTGLHKIWDFYGRNYIGSDPGFLKYDYKWTPGLWDTREVAYHLAAISYCALYDADSGYRAKCGRWTRDAIQTLFTEQRSADGGWAQPWGLHYGSFKDQSSVTLTHGSKVVAGNGTAWTARQFEVAKNGWRASIWFLPRPKYPASNADGEPTAYQPTYVSPTRLMLDRPYEGESGVKYWIASDSALDGTPLVGYGALPYMEGLLGMAFDFASKALSRVDPAAAEKAREFCISAANWIVRYGYRQDTGGLNYVAQTVNCRAPIPLNDGPCAAGGGVLSSHEAIRGMMQAYMHNHDPVLRIAIDRMYNTLWAKPGTCPPGSTVCIASPNYASVYDDDGWNMTNPSPNGSGAKWFGQPWGIGAEAAWPAARAGRMDGKRQQGGR